MAEGWKYIPSPFSIKLKTMKIKLSAISVEIELAHPEYCPVFAPFATDEPPVATISVCAQDVDNSRKIYGSEATDPYIEYMELCPKVSDALLPSDCVIFHGTAFVWRGKAWILAAISGTGKTTQFLRWKELYDADVQILNGDKPLLAFGKDRIWVHPSPWTGKESMGQMISAPLGGIILLQQAGENHMRRMTAKEAAGLLFVQFLFSRKTAADVTKVCLLEERLLQETPVWMLENRGDRASTQLCHDALLEEIR